MPKEFHYSWKFDLDSSPAQLWPLVADTNRFNRDTGVPTVQPLPETSGPAKNARRRLRLSAFGIPVEWEEQPFEWVRPQRFGVVRRYSKGPISELRVRVELKPRPKSEGEPRTDDRDSAGTSLTYEVWAQPRNLIGTVAIPIQIGIVSARNFARTLRDYDRLARHGLTAASEPKM